MLIVDDLDVQDFLSAGQGDERSGSPEVWVSLLMPTHRSGPETTSGAIMLKNLLRSAAQQTDEADRDWLDQAVEPLIADHQFWQFQGDGLAVFVSPNTTRIQRLSIPLAPEARVADTPHLVPLAPILARQREASILQLSLGQVRLFKVTGEIIEEAELGPIPASIDELTTDRDHQAQLQFTGQGKGGVSFHGHGGDGSIDEARRDRFLRHVARGLEEREAAQRAHGPLFLAATQDTADLFARLSGRPELIRRLISGSADGVRPADLLERARPVLDAFAERRQAEHREHLGQRRSQGRVLEAASAVVEAATHGRVEVLYVGPVDDEDIDRTNRAIIETLRNSGEVLASPETGDGVVATLRF
ncbi:hypothetical protein [Granulicoccus sp. GXG6511]|uniref:baeRF3 domain-containing protein n=1 Tax=Granulicoccus sp. GXG6511 TaxID=3381351 RepID=UPI003D7C8733